jgi:hypothetical protein
MVDRAAIIFALFALAPFTSAQTWKFGPTSTVVSYDIATVMKGAGPMSADVYSITPNTPSSGASQVYSTFPRLA